MESIGIFMFLMNVGCGALFAVISIPLLRKEVEMNHLYGFRISKAFESKENWQKINQHGARGMLIWSIILMAAAPLALVLDLENSLFLLTFFAFLPLIVFVPIINTCLYARKL